MTLSYNFGLTFGSLSAYLLDKILGPVSDDPCAIHLIPLNISTSSTMSTYTSTLASSILPFNNFTSTMMPGDVSTIFSFVNNTME